MDKIPLFGWGIGRFIMFFNDGLNVNRSCILSDLQLSLTE